MKNYTYDFRLLAESDKEADQKMAALTILVTRLTASELHRLAHILQHDPVKTALAKKYLHV